MVHTYSRVLKIDDWFLEFFRSNFILFSSMNVYGIINYYIFVLFTIMEMVFALLFTTTKGRIKVNRRYPKFYVFIRSFDFYVSSSYNMTNGISKSHFTESWFCPAYANTHPLIEAVQHDIAKSMQQPAATVRSLCRSCCLRSSKKS